MKPEDCIAYNIIDEFVTWCEQNDYTEWLGYNKKEEEIINLYFKEKIKRGWNEKTNI